MTIRELAKLVAEEFNKAVKEAECENFKEMRRLYDWDANDIRGEISYMVREQENMYDSGICSLDDGTMCNFKDFRDPDNECTYGTFKKMVYKGVFYAKLQNFLY